MERIKNIINKLKIKQSIKGIFFNNCNIKQNITIKNKQNGDVNINFQNINKE